MKLFCISGLGADQRVFKFLTLEHELIPVEWIQPELKESIVSYSKRIIQTYNMDESDNFGILGVSFGGLVAVEISKLLNPKITIIISSVETRKELSGFIRIAGKINLVTLIPKKMLNPPKAFVHYMFGAKNKLLLNSILADTDVNFTKWALQELINWQNNCKLENIMKIGGTKDKLLKQKGENTIFVKDGGHFMIVDKANEISEIINEKLRF